LNNEQLAARTLWTPGQFSPRSYEQAISSSDAR